MGTRTARRELYRLTTESPEHAYSKGSVVHSTYKPGLPETKTEWKREKVIGSGGFGIVWLEKNGGGELRAVKSLPKRNFKANFLREVDALAELRNHRDSFVHFLGWFEDAELIFIAMEYTEHGDLRKYITDSRPRARREVREITRQLLEGLVVLHEKKICHRDLNPQNVLIASFSPILVKIADFGVSKHEIDTELRTHCGTQGYHAPEQRGLLPRKFQIGRSYTNAADLWALGCLVHEILTSEIPFLDREVDSNAMTSGLETGAATQILDLFLLYQYCDGTDEFPAASLDASITGEEGIDLVRGLLIVDPKCRTSALDALRSPWLCEKSDSETLRSQLASLGIGISLETADHLVSQGDCAYTAQALSALTTKSIQEIQHAGATNGYHLLVKSLLGAIDNIDFRIYGVTSLQSAARNGHLDMVKLLLSSGADVNARPCDYFGRTALQAAAGGGHLDVAKLLLSSGADVNADPCSGPGGWTALQAAAKGGHLDVVKLLLSSGADANARSSVGTALELVSRRGYQDVVGLLSTYEADTEMVYII